MPEKKNRRAGSCEVCVLRPTLGERPTEPRDPASLSSSIITDVLRIFYIFADYIHNKLPFQRLSKYVSRAVDHTAFIHGLIIQQSYTLVSSSLNSSDGACMHPANIVILATTSSANRLYQSPLGSKDPYSISLRCFLTVVSYDDHEHPQAKQRVLLSVSIRLKYLPLRACQATLKSRAAANQSG